MSKSKLLGRYSAMESDVPDAPVAEVDVDEDGAALDVTDTTESTALDAADVEAPVIAEAEVEVDQLTDASDSLEAWLDFVQEEGREGGLAKRTAKAVMIGIGNVCRPMQVSSESFIGFGMASVESFSGRDGAHRTTSLESAITDALKNIWDAIKRAVNKLITYVRDWYLKNWDSASRMKKRAEALREKANSTNGTAEKKKIPVPGMQQLHIAKAAPTAAQITSALDEVKVQAASIMSSKQGDAYKEGLETIADGIESMKAKAGGGSAAVASDFWKKVNSKLPVPAKTYTTSPDKHAERFSGLGAASSRVRTSGELPGGRAVMYFMGANLASNLTGSDDDATKAATSASQAFFDIRDYSDKKVEVDTSKEADVLKPSQVADICAGVSKAMDVIIDYKGAYSKHEAATKAFLTKMDSIVKKAVAEDESDEEKTRVRSIRMTATSSSQMIKSQSRSITSFTGYLITTSRAALNWCNACLAQYKSA